MNWKDLRPGRLVSSNTTLSRPNRQRPRGLKRARRPDQWIEPLEVPELREVETDRRRRKLSARLRLLDQPCYAALHRIGRCLVGMLCERLDRQRGLLDR